MATHVIKAEITFEMEEMEGTSEQSAIIVQELVQSGQVPGTVTEVGIIEHFDAKDGE